MEIVDTAPIINNEEIVSDVHTPSGDTAPVTNTAEQTQATDGHEYSHEITLYAEPVLHTQNFAVTNALLTSWVAVFFIILVAFIIRLNLKKLPGRFQSIIELLIEGALSTGDQITGSRKMTVRCMPIAISVFFFVLINNWTGLLPLMAFGLIEHGTTFVPFLRGATADINTTVALAVISVIGANIFGAFSIGTWKMFNKYVNIKALAGIFTKVRKDPTIILVAPITFAIGIIELVGEGAKVASLSLRLFGNIFAGEVLLVSMGAMMAYVVPIPFLILEVFVGMIQAFIFAVLTMVYFTIAAQDHDHEHEEKEAHHGVAEEHGAHVLDIVPGDEAEGVTATAA